MTDHIADILDGLVLFQDFSYPELKTISRFVTHVAHKQGEVLFEEGDPGDTMLILAEGKLSIFKGGEHGTQLLSHEGRGRMVGEMALLDNERRAAPGVADTDCEVLSLSLEGLSRMSRETPLLAYKFMFSLARILSRRLRKTSGLLVDFLS